MCIRDRDQKELPVNLDVGKFMQAMENLLENARKYSNPDSEIVLSAKREGALIHLCLSNETTKIREEDLERLFERFYKTDEARTSSASTGLGPVSYTHLDVYKRQFPGRRLRW